MCYIVVLSLLLADKYEMELGTILEATASSKTKLLQILNVLPVRQKGSTSLITLKLPSQMRAANTTFVRKRRTF